MYVGLRKCFDGEIDNLYNIFSMIKCNISKGNLIATFSPFIQSHYVKVMAASVQLQMEKKVLQKVNGGTTFIYFEYV